MDIKRRAALGLATLGIALGAGHLVQNQSAPAATAAAEAPTSIVPLAATEVPAPPALASLLPDLPAPPMLAAPTGLPAAPAPVAPVAAADPCAVTLAVTPAAGAMLDVTLLAPCLPAARVVLRHGGMAITALTSGTGSLITRLPALSSDGAVSIRFADGARAEASAAVDLTGLRRVAVQWKAEDRLSLNAFENGAAWGAPGHLSAARPADDRFVTLGAATVPLPMMADVYTYPADPSVPVDVTVEAEVNAATCNRDLRGEAIDSYSGTVSTVELTLAMPGCDAAGGFLVLNNLWSGPKLAAAD